MMMPLLMFMTATAVVHSGSRQCTTRGDLIWAGMKGGSTRSRS